MHVKVLQFEISDPAALVFSQSFYQAIADGLPVDVATVEARRAIFAEGSEVEWATPVLYLRSTDGRIFTRARISQGERQTREEGERHARKEGERQAREEEEGEKAFSLGERLQGQGDVAGAQAASQRAIDYPVYTARASPSATCSNSRAMCPARAPLTCS